MKFITALNIIILISIIMTTNTHAQEETLKDMILIPGGEFIMGKDFDRDVDFRPAHKVYIDSFYIDAYEVTNGEYLKFCNETGHRLPEFWNVTNFHCSETYFDYPVVGVSWSDAKKYSEWAGKRLPSEAEWEYAARGGLINKDFPNGNNWEIPLRRNDNNKQWENLTVEVKNFEPNGYGLYDMGGNVWEWVNDIYQYDYYDNSVEKNPRGPDKGTVRVIRGGSWHSGEMCHKVFYRKGITANWLDFAIGFRCAKNI